MSANQYYNQNPNNSGPYDQQRQQQYGQQQYGQQQYQNQNQNQNHHHQQQQQQQQGGENEKGLFSTVVGAGIGGYAGKKLTHDSTLGKVAGGILGGYIMRHGVPGHNSHDKKHDKKHKKHDKK